MFRFFNAHHKNRRFAKLRSLGFFESSVLFVLVCKVLYNYHETIGASSVVDQTWNNLVGEGGRKQNTPDIAFDWIQFQRRISKLELISRFLLEMLKLFHDVLRS